MLSAVRQTLRISMGGKIHKGRVTVIATRRTPESEDLLCVPYCQELSDSKQTKNNDSEPLWQIQSAHNTPATSSCKSREAFESCARRWEQSKVFLCAHGERWGQMRHWSVLISCLLSRYFNTHTSWALMKRNAKTTPTAVRTQKAVEILLKAAQMLESCSRS